MPMDSRIPTGRVFPEVSWVSDWGEGGLGNGEELLGREGEFCHSESCQGERKKVPGVHVPL